MINYTDTQNTSKLLSLEINSLNASLIIQKSLNKQILSFLKTCIGDVKIEIDFNPSNKIYHYLNEAMSSLNKSNNNILAIQQLIDTLNKISSHLKNYPEDLIKLNIKIYNSDFTTAMTSVYENTDSIEKFIREISFLDISTLAKEDTAVTEEMDSDTNYTVSSEEIDSSFIENTLIISDLQGKVIFPYQLAKIKEILIDCNDKYTSLQDVIEKLYTKPMKYYRFSSVARFKEAYKLMIHKEHSSKLKALSLASELFMNYSLHPAIITACHSLDELDIYLACLEDNVLEDFKGFSIKYEIPPAITKDVILT